jgi:hypothetical protein
VYNYFFGEEKKNSTVISLKPVLSDSEREPYSEKNLSEKTVVRG